VDVFAPRKAVGANVTMRANANTKTQAGPADLRNAMNHRPSDRHVRYYKGSSVREAAVDFLVGICIGLAVLFSFAAMKLVFDTFYPREEHAYRAASEPRKSNIGRMRYGAGLKQSSDTRSRAAPVSYRSWNLPIMKLDQQLRGRLEAQFPDRHGGKALG
jgi:hypothetical protein